MSIESSFTLCPQPHSAFSWHTEQKRPSLLVQSLQRYNSPTYDTCSSQGAKNGDDQQGTGRFQSGTNFFSMSKSGERIDGATTTFQRPAVKTYSPFELLVHERGMSYGPISPLSQEEYNAWKKRDIQVAEAGGLSIVGIDRAGIASVDAKLLIRVDGKDPMKLVLPTTSQNQRMQIETRKRILASMSDGSNSNKTTFSAPRAIRATPSEPMDHRRAKMQGVWSSFLLEQYDADSSGHSTAKFQGKLSNGHDINDNENGATWKRRCLRAQIDKCYTRKNMLSVLEENRQLNIQLINQQAARLSMTNFESTASRKPRPVQDASAQTDVFSVPSDNLEATIDNEKLHVASITTAGSSIDGDTAEIAGEKEIDKAVNEVVSIPGDESELHATREESYDGSNRVSNEIEKGSFANLSGETADEAHCDKPSFVNDTRNNGSRQLPSAEHKDMLEMANFSEQNGRPDDDSMMLACGNATIAQEDSSQFTSQSSQKKKRLAFDVRLVQVEPGDRRPSPSPGCNATILEPVETQFTPLRSSFEPFSAGKNDTIKVEVIVDDGFENSITALNVSAITTTSTPSPMTNSRSENHPPSTHGLFDDQESVKGQAPQPSMQAIESRAVSIVAKNKENKSKNKSAAKKGQNKSEKEKQSAVAVRVTRSRARENLRTSSGSIECARNTQDEQAKGKGTRPGKVVSNGCESHESYATTDDGSSKPSPEGSMASKDNESHSVLIVESDNEKDTGKRRYGPLLKSSIDNIPSECEIAPESEIVTIDKVPATKADTRLQHGKVARSSQRKEGGTVKEGDHVGNDPLGHHGTKRSRRRGTHAATLKMPALKKRR
jgi:hypothetical protein